MVQAVLQLCQHGLKSARTEASLRAFLKILKLSSRDITRRDQHLNRLRQLQRDR